MTVTHRGRDVVGGDITGALFAKKDQQFEEQDGGKKKKGTAVGGGRPRHHSWGIVGRVLCPAKNQEGLFAFAPKGGGG